MDVLRFFEAISGDDSACAVDEDRRILAVSPGWQRFARANGARRDVLGLEYDSVLAEPLRGFFRDAFAAVRKSGEPWDHDYECSSADTRRLFRMRIYPLDDGFGIVHALRFEEPYPDPGVEPNPVHVEQGVITMCCYCRKVRNWLTHRWDWVPVYVRALPSNVSHGLCAVCATHYYGPR